MECSAAPRRDDTRFHREELLGDVARRGAADRSPARRARAHRPRRAAPTRAGSRRPSAGRATRCSSPAAAAPASARASRTARATGRRSWGSSPAGSGSRSCRGSPTPRRPPGVVIVPLDRRPAQAPRVRRLPRRRRVRARDPRRARRARRQRPPADAAGPRCMTRPSSSTSTACSSTPSRSGTRRAATSSTRTAARGASAATRDMLGMSSHEWSVYVVEELGARLTPEEVNAAVVEAMLAGYRERLPLLPGAREAVERIGRALPARARVLLEPPGDRPRARAHGRRPTASSPRSPRRRSRAASPRPTSTRRSCAGSASSTAAAIEDSEAGIRSAHAAGLRVIAIPNPHFPPGDDALALADEVLPDLDALASRPIRAAPSSRQAGPSCRQGRAGEGCAAAPPEQGAHLDPRIALREAPARPRRRRRARVHVRASFPRPPGRLGQAQGARRPGRRQRLGDAAGLEHRAGRRPQEVRRRRDHAAGDRRLLDARSACAPPSRSTRRRS